MTLDFLWGVYGAGGAGRGILPLLRPSAENASARLVFIDDTSSEKTINGHDVLNWQEFVAASATDRRACLAVANSAVRAELAKKCQAARVPLLSASANSVIVMDNVIVGDGACLSPFVTLTSNITIGKCFHANLYSYVEHDCVIGDFVTFAPGAKCNGNVVIEDHAYIGSGAVIRQGTPVRPLRIGRGATIGMGAVVTKDVAPGLTVAGNPARPLQKKSDA
jgi:sugar O-acyltransferase (sialic acid O-acetyltransferase NeuD family)